MRLCGVQKVNVVNQTRPLLMQGPRIIVKAEMHYAQATAERRWCSEFYPSKDAGRSPEDAVVVATRSISIELGALSLSALAGRQRKGEKVK